MPYCPLCRAEFREGFTRCEACREDLVPQLEAQSFGEHYSPQAMAELLVGRSVVPVFTGPVTSITRLRDAFAGVDLPVAVGEPPGGCQSCQPQLTLLAATEDRDRALDVFFDSFQSRLGLGDVIPHETISEPDEALAPGELPLCPACGARYTPGPDAECPECGLFLG